VFRIYSKLFLFLNCLSRLLFVPPSVESRIVEFVSSGDDGIESVLSLRQVCKTTKSWIDNLPSRIARRVFSKAFASIKNTQVTEQCVTSLREFSPPPGLTTLHLQIFFGSDVDNNTTHFQNYLDFWANRLEVISLKMFTFDLIDNKHREIASVINTFLANSANLREVIFHIRSLVDLYLLKEFLLGRQSTRDNNGQIHIHLIFGRPWYSIGDGLIELSETLRSILVCIFENKSIFKVDIMNDDFLVKIKNVAGSATSVYDNFLKTVTRLECNKVSERADNDNPLSQFLSLESFTCGSVFEMGDITIPATVKHLRLRRNPTFSLPEFLTSFHLDDCYDPISRTEIINLILKIENECPNLVTLYVRWKLAYAPEPIEGIVRRRCGNGFSSKF